MKLQRTELTTVLFAFSFGIIQSCSADKHPTNEKDAPDTPVISARMVDKKKESASTAPLIRQFRGCKAHR